MMSNQTFKLASSSSKVSQFKWFSHLHVGYFALDSSCCAARSKRNCRAVRDLGGLDDVWKWDRMQGQAPGLHPRYVLNQ